jgi:hypothetical protein
MRFIGDDDDVRACGKDGVAFAVLGAELLDEGEDVAIPLDGLSLLRFVQYRARQGRIGARSGFPLA